MAGITILMQLAGCNLMSVGIFAWSALEPEEGVYDMDWLEEVLDRLGAAGIKAFLATPSGARPAWMSFKYPEVLRVRPDGQRNFHGNRHNHCCTSPVYREFVRKINTELARRFGHHPAVVGWHISNEFSGDCHCEKCQEAFRGWLKNRYGALDALNHAMMGSELHLHVDLEDKSSAILRIPTLDLSQAQREGLVYGSTLRLTFPEKATHLFDPVSQESLLA